MADLYRIATPRDAWDRFRAAAHGDEYSPIPAALPAVVVAAFGDTRLVYVLAVVNLYLAGFAAAAWLFVRRFTRAGSLAVALPLVLTLTSTVGWGPVLRGYLDVGGAALATLALLAYLSRPAGRLRWTDVLLVAGLLAAMTLFRRWYSFFAVAFALCAGVDTGWAALRGGWRKAVRRVGPLALVGVWLVALLASFAFGWVYRAATTNYADVYAAYKLTNPLAERVWHIVGNWGPATVAVAASSLTINQTMFICADRSLGAPHLDGRRVVGVPEVDRTGGFPVGFLRADLVVAASPPQWHLRPEEQQVVLVTAESLRLGRDIGTAFERLPERFVLTDPGWHGPVEVCVYRRVRPITGDALAAYCDRLRAAHPTRPHVFTPPPGTERYLRHPTPR